jgi:hypothetical protein
VSNLGVEKSEKKTSCHSNKMQRKQERGKRRSNGALNVHTSAPLVVAIFSSLEYFIRRSDEVSHDLLTKKKLEETGINPTTTLSRDPKT